ncbi:MULTISPECIES: hypothetical protein [unclassified Herbaspirillum]|uniref:hypothetical protein n=1 Tax=unclassified Herbaspirillum TaxID=2624150 RepID=UPI001154A2CF|nr:MULTISPECIES: hypothetical protein [unclassified Herbaspirillum]MBB5392573.1 hypothetical protein [Herbaspirillum sp. SJZ102]TQK06210.1 hypothetical protein FB599_2356 [Herbaspirillum sp. SJZ130]TQK12312.1 hypothetical protein FB598_2264 [Herbaspirillum sp. SJZ106]
MKPTNVWSKESLAAALLCAAAGLAAPLAVAQQPQQAPSAQPAPPPELEKLEEGEPPAVTIRKPGDDGKGSGNSIKEHRDHGQTKEIEVKSGPSTYYLRPNQNLGSSTPGDAQSGPPTNAQWKVGEFDWGVKKKPDGSGNDSGDANAK